MNTDYIPKTVSSPISLKQVSISDPFWSKEMELIRKEVIPYQWEALNDRIPDAAPSYCMRNFKVAGKLTRKRKENNGQAVDKDNSYDTVAFTGAFPTDTDQLGDHFYGCVFQDSDFAKWIEAVGYSLAQYPDPELEAIADEAIDIVCAAQQDDGYLDTYYIINGLSKRFTNLRWNHELYCFGHLLEGAIAYYEGTGKDKLLNAMKKYTDYIDSCFGWEEEKLKGYPGHEITEMALARLYQITGEQKYMDLCNFFLDVRGTRPYYFDKENHSDYNPKDALKIRYQYHQAHLPVREQIDAVGHSVRATYLYSGMADAARLNGDAKMFQACERLWESITNKRMYITGGIGSTHIWEAFTFDYDLPNDTVYAETCASIGLVFFARRMLEMNIDSKYSDVMERALYNGILSGMALDGKSFFYVNPLEVFPEACHKDERKFHVKSVRQKWFGCACCPPNLARLLSSIASYAYTENEDHLFMHLYMGCELDKEFNTGKVHFSIQSELPRNGKVTITPTVSAPTKYTLAVRIPEWCSSYTLNGKPGITEGCVKEDDTVYEVKKGYLYITKTWTNKDVTALDFAMDVRLMRSHSAVREDQGRVALMRGPLVYCLEEIDNGKNLHNIYLDPAQTITTEISNELSEGMVILKTIGRRYAEDEPGQSLYCTFSQPSYTETYLRFVPYYAWNNRGEGEMQVWTRYVLS